MKGLAKLLNLFFPLSCLNCSLPITEGWVCDLCKKEIRSGIFLKEPVPIIKAIAIKYQYEGVVRQAIEIWKYTPSPALGKKLIELDDASVWGKIINEHQFDGIVPIPPHKAHYRERGFDPVYQFATYLAKKTKRPIQRPLVRTGIQKPQVQVKEKERRSNVIGKFKIVGSTPQKLILVDDVMTTGSTVLEAANTLHKNGAEEIFVVVLAAALSKLQFLKTDT